MDLKAYYRTYSSDSSAGTANQVLTADPEPVERTGRVWFRLEHGGENYSLLFSKRNIPSGTAHLSVQPYRDHSDPDDDC